MTGVRDIANVVKGSALMVFAGTSSLKPVAYATSHSLSISKTTSEVSTKDAGDFPSLIVQGYTWEVTAENLYSAEGAGQYLEWAKSKNPVTLQFAQIDDWGDPEPGVLTPNGRDTEWQPGTVLASGKALVTNYQVNAPAGDNATLSVTFTGIGFLDDGSSNSGNGGDNSSGDQSQGAGGTSGAQGVQGPQGEG